MSDTVDIEKIVDYIKKNGDGMSQLALSKKLKVSRYQIKKALKFILGEEDSTTDEPEDDGKVEPTDELTVTSTGNDCVSLTPKKTAPCSVGDVFVDGKGQQLHIILVDSETSMVWWVTGLGSIEGQTVSSAKFRNWKRKKGIEYSSLNRLIVHAYTRFVENNLSDKGWTDSFLDNNPLPDYEADYQLTLEANNKHDEIQAQHSVTDEVVMSGGAELTTSKDLVSTDAVKQSPYKLIVSSRSVTLIDGDEALVVTKDNVDGYAAAIIAINTYDWIKLKDICSGRKATVTNYKTLLEPFGFNIVEGFVVMNDSTGSFRLGGLEVLTKRLAYYSSKGDTDAINNVGLFINKLLDNPDQRVMDRIVEFIKFADIEIDNEGDLLVYKYVNGDYKDSYSRRLDNSPGSVVKMKRVLIDPNKESLCSQGLHVCSASYVSKTGGGNSRLVLCKLNPRDIVSIPVDYNGAKIRACEYKVLKDVTASYVTGKIKVDHNGVFMK